VRPSWSEIPADYDRRIRAIREELGKSRAGFAALIGAARKAVVYQWESRKRCPSPVFWRRIIEVASNGTQKAS
jgi:DNA-binding transcriptional regulator YiaG